MNKIECAVCDDLDVQDPREIVEEFVDMVCFIMNHGDQQELVDTLAALFSEGYRQGYIASTMLRIEEDAATLKYITNNWD